MKREALWRVRDGRCDVSVGVLCCRVNETAVCRGLPHLWMMIARRTPSTIKGILREGPPWARAAAHHRSGKLHDGRWLHLRGMNRARCQRDLFNVSCVGLLPLLTTVARLRKPRMPCAALPPRSGRRPDWRCVVVDAQGLACGSGRDGGQLVLRVIAGRRRIRHAVYRQTREDLVACGRIDRQDREKGGERGRAQSRRQG